MSRDTGPRTIAHLSDVHATAHGLLGGTVNGLARLHRAGEQLRESHVRLDAIIITGDLVERGESGAYPAVSASLRELADTAEAPVLTVLGNHDEPRAARQLSGHESSHHRVVTIDGLRIALLDSHNGSLGDEQLAWLDTELDDPAPRGTVVALHHPPLCSPLPALAAARLRDAPGLLDVLEGRDVRVVLAGHYHHSMSAVCRGIPISVASSLAYHHAMDADPGRPKEYDEVMFSLVHLLPQGIAATDVELTSPAPLFTTALPIPNH